jgi:hypothetical protein
MPNLPADYDQNVFINCPFDDEYHPIFQVLVFATFEGGFRPRCALEVQDGTAFTPRPALPESSGGSKDL